MTKHYLWQEPLFPHFYHNPAVVKPLERAFKEAVDRLDVKLRKQNHDFADVFTEEILSNSEIEGVLLDRESVYSSFVHNIAPVREKESGAVALVKIALAHYHEPLRHELLFSMHREIMKGANFPDESIGVYVGNMKIVHGRHLDREPKVIHEGVGRDQVHERMTEFIEWYNRCPADTPLVNAIQGHVHFEILHPFCDGNGRIGRNLILMSLSRDLGRATPLALSRSFQLDLGCYYRQFNAGLDLTGTIEMMGPLFLNAVEETGRILELTVFRKKITNHTKNMNARQKKVLNRLVDYELRGGFEGGMSNAKYQKMTGVAERTALRDLGELHALGLLFKTGRLKATRYFLNVPYLVQKKAPVRRPGL